MIPQPLPPGLLATLRAFRAGRLTPAAYRAACLAQAAACEPWLKAFVHRPDALPPLGPEAASSPLGGIPVAVKDVIDTADLPTENGAAADAGRRPARDAWIVGRIRALGGIVFGKTVTTEYAWRHPGATVNPHAPAHTPGGSSSGSAAAVAAGIVPLALGTQTVGSVIRPAAYCGIVGLKPSYGAIPRTGVQPLAGSLDHLGLFTRSVGDAAYALSLFAGQDEADPHGVALQSFSVDIASGLASLASPPRLALLPTLRWDLVDASQRAALAAAAARFTSAGAVVDTIALPGMFDVMWDWTQTLLAVEASAIHAARIRDVPEKVSPALQALAAAGAAMPGAAYAEAREGQVALRAAFGAVLDGFDAILTVPARGAAPLGLEQTGDAALCAPWSFLGAPAITLPAALDGALPLGVQLVGRIGGDAALLQVAAWAEAVLAEARA